MSANKKKGWQKGNARLAHFRFANPVPGKSRPRLGVLAERIYARPIIARVGIVHFST